MQSDVSHSMDTSGGSSPASGGALLLSDVVDEVVPMTPTDTSSDTGDADLFNRYSENKEQAQDMNNEGDMSVFNFEDSSVSTDGGGRSLRRRTSRPDFKNFLENFDPGNSNRELRKKKKKLAHRGEAFKSISCEYLYEFKLFNPLMIQHVDIFHLNLYHF